MGQVGKRDPNGQLKSTKRKKEQFMPTVTIPTGSTSRITIPAKNKHWKPNSKGRGDIERIGVSVEEAAIMLSLCVRSVWVLIKDGRLQHVKFGTRCIVSVRSLREFVDGKQESETPLEHGDESRGEKNSP
jgi:hypothetical protein